MIMTINMYVVVVTLSVCILKRFQFHNQTGPSMDSANVPNTLHRVCANTLLTTIVPMHTPMCAPITPVRTRSLHQRTQSLTKSKSDT